MLLLFFGIKYKFDHTADIKEKGFIKQKMIFGYTNQRLYYVEFPMWYAAKKFEKYFEAYYVIFSIRATSVKNAPKTAPNIVTRDF